MPKQDFYVSDYLGPIAAAVIFAFCLLVISFFLLNYFFVLKTDELTVFERFGSKHNFRLGPHSMSSIKRRSQKNLLDDQDQRPIITASDSKESTRSPMPIPEVQVDAASIN